MRKILGRYVIGLSVFRVYMKTQIARGKLLKVHKHGIFSSFSQLHKVELGSRKYTGALDLSEVEKAGSFITSSLARTTGNAKEVPCPLVTLPYSYRSPKLPRKKNALGRHRGSRLQGTFKNHVRLSSLLPSGATKPHHGGRTHSPQHRASTLPQSETTRHHPMHLP